MMIIVVRLLGRKLLEVEIYGLEPEPDDDRPDVVKRRQPGQLRRGGRSAMTLILLGLALICVIVWMDNNR